VRPRRVLPIAVLALAALTFAPRPARALEAIVFVSSGSPGDVWGSGLGGSLTSSLFHLVMLDAELARQNYETADGKLLTFSVAACLAPSFGHFTPYAGFGVGLSRETLGSLSDNGTLSSLVAGGKFRLGLLMLRAEYRTFALSGTPFVELNHRVYVGGGISF
jgi:hypothetical protein